MNIGMIELRCSRELALWLGAFEPSSPAHHRELRASGQYMMLRDRITLRPMFWLYMGQPPAFDSREGAV